MSRRPSAPVARPQHDPDPFYQIALKEGARDDQRLADRVADRRPERHGPAVSRLSLSTRRESLSSHRHRSDQVQSSPIPPPPARDALPPAAHTPQKYPIPARNHYRNASADLTNHEARDLQRIHHQTTKLGITPPTLSTAILDAPLGSRRSSSFAAPQSATLPPSSDLYSRSTAAAAPQSAHPLRYSSSRRPSTSFDAAARETSPLRSPPDGTESVVSTTAPSTVWDELGELKSRIRKLELTGKPRKPGVAMPQTSFPDLNERPRTSTTQTTNDTSPLMSQHPSPMANNNNTGAGAEPSDLHPLLRQALGKAKSRLDANIYKYLEAVAFDALELATMTRGTEVSDSASVFTSNTNADPRSERRMRRKADNVCRGLTELSIALCEGKAAGERGAPSRPVSRDNVSHYSRDNFSHLDARNLLERKPSERLRSRFQTRRGSGATKSDFLDEASPTRAGTMRRMSQFASSDYAIDGNDPTLEAMPVRAMTEIANFRTQTSNTAASAYASKHLQSHSLGTPTPKHLLSPPLGTPTSYLNDVTSSASRSSSTARTARRHSLRLETTAARDDDNPRLSSYSFTPRDDDSTFSPSTRPGSARRQPPSAAANLQERLDIKRSQRVATAQQLGGLSSPIASSPATGMARRPPSSGRDVRA